MRSKGVFRTASLEFVYACIKLPSSARMLSVGKKPMTSCA